MQDVKLLDKVIFPKFFESDMKWLLQTAASPYKCLNLIFNVCSFVLTFFILCKSLAYIAQVTNMNLFRQYITCIQVQYVFTSYKKLMVLVGVSLPGVFIGPFQKTGLRGGNVCFLLHTLLNIHNCTRSEHSVCKPVKTSDLRIELLMSAE